MNCIQNNNCSLVTTKSTGGEDFAHGVGGVLYNSIIAIMSYIIARRRIYRCYILSL